MQIASKSSCLAGNVPLSTQRHLHLLHSVVSACQDLMDQGVPLGLHHLLQVQPSVEDGSPAIDAPFFWGACALEAKGL